MKINELIESRNLIEQQIHHALETLRKQNIECDCKEGGEEDWNNIYSSIEDTSYGFIQYNYCIKCGKCVSETGSGE